MQSIVGRKVDPVDPAVVSVGTIQGGTSFNCVASAGSLEGAVQPSLPLHASPADGPMQADGVLYEIAIV